MLKRRNRGVKVVGGLALTSVAILVLLIPFDEGISTEGLGDDFEFDVEFDFCDPTIGENETQSKECIELDEQSVLPPQPKIADSNDSVVQQFLDTLRISDTRAIGIETVVTQYNLAGKSQTSSSVFPIPFSLETPEGFLVDNIQVAFFGISAEDPFALNLQGTVDFLIDDKIVATKRLWASSSVFNQNQIPLKVVNSVPPPINDRPETFDFTFTDELF